MKGQVWVHSCLQFVGVYAEADHVDLNTRGALCVNVKLSGLPSRRHCQEDGGGHRHARMDARHTIKRGDGPRMDVIVRERVARSAHHR